jgi:membrane-associated phospholipid phosphatase
MVRPVGRSWLLGISVIVVLFVGTSHVRAQVDVREVSCESPFTDDALRHPHANIAKRTGLDLLAVPASVVAWDAGDWALFGGASATTLSLMLPSDERSLDVRFQRWLLRHETRSADQLFVKVQTIPAGFLLASYGAMLFGTAWITGNRSLFEFGSLQLEALGVAQFYHIVMKLLMGREGPYQEGGDGEIFGPTRIFFPGGTPSGHAATVYAVMTVAAEYWDKWPVTVLAHLGGVYIASSLVYNRQHFVSDVVWGGAMGYAIGRFIVRHRSSRYRCRARTETAWQRALWFPVLSERGAALVLSMRF